MTKEKRINVRVDDQEFFSELNGMVRKRKTTWQGLILPFLENWLKEQQSSIPPTEVPRVKATLQFPDSPLQFEHGILDRILQGPHQRTMQVILRALAKDEGAHGEGDGNTQKGPSDDPGVDALRQLGEKTAGISEIIQDGVALPHAPATKHPKKAHGRGGDRKPRQGGPAKV